jgi:hypothetical protein
MMSYKEFIKENVNEPDLDFEKFEDYFGKKFDNANNFYYSDILNIGIVLYNNFTYKTQNDKKPLLKHQINIYKITPAEMLDIYLDNKEGKLKFAINNENFLINNHNLFGLLYSQRLLPSENITHKFNVEEFKNWLEQI